MVSSTVGTDLVNIRVMHLRGQNYRERVPNHHGNGRPVTIEDLTTLCFLNWNDDPDGSTLLLVLQYMRNHSAVLPDCICNV